MSDGGEDQGAEEAFMGLYQERIGTSVLEAVFSRASGSKIISFQRVWNPTVLFAMTRFEHSAQERLSWRILHAVAAAEEDVDGGVTREMAGGVPATLSEGRAGWSLAVGVASVHSPAC